MERRPVPMSSALMPEPSALALPGAGAVRSVTSTHLCSAPSCSSPPPPNLSTLPSSGTNEAMRNSSDKPSTPGMACAMCTRRSSAKAAPTEDAVRAPRVRASSASAPGATSQSFAQIAPACDTAASRNAAICTRAPSSARNAARPVLNWAFEALVPTMNATCCVRASCASCHSNARACSSSAPAILTPPSAAAAPSAARAQLASSLAADSTRRAALSISPSARARASRTRSLRFKSASPASASAAPAAAPALLRSNAESSLSAPSPPRARSTIAVSSCVLNSAASASATSIRAASDAAPS
mmetsp:Transcript_1594/g.4215  ORF Transcript_1594/g.4215 Transcript_1594/m.4215 type:complete len:300 (-) Transcript_1594:2537-3436(-)